jgi:hypothetical protein
VRQRAAREVVGEPLDVEGAAPGVDGARLPRLQLQKSWVLRAMRALKSVGKARASSRELVCRLWVWPPAAAMASTQVRGTLLKTSCAARLQPLVWQWVRSDSERSSWDRTRA